MSTAATSPAGTVATKDGTQIFYKDWGTGQPVVFSHGWPLNADAWDDQMAFVAANGLRGIAHDRRGHGRSSQPWDGNDMDTYADDLAEVIEALDLHDVVLVGHSTGGGEVVRYAAQRADGRVSKIFTAGAVPPTSVRSDTNPDGTPRQAFDQIRAGVLADRSQFYLTVLQGPVRPVLRHQPPGQPALAGSSRRLLAADDDRRPQGRLRLRQRVVRDRLHRRPPGDRHPDDHRSGRRRPDRPHQGRGDEVHRPGQDGRAQGLPGAPHGIAGPYQQALDRDILAFIS
jgi:non-heme chloroperoxidase